MGPVAMAALSYDRHEALPSDGVCVYVYNSRMSFIVVGVCGYCDC